jgi:LysR family transcriptional regulator, hypochlorite-specific transcription factor HypT
MPAPWRRLTLTPRSSILAAMDLKLIEDLMALKRCGSYVRAAEERHVTHPAFGRRIRSLEAWAGVPLVLPGRSPVQLSAAGDALLAEGAPMLASLSRVRAQWRSSGSGDGVATDLLRIGTGRTLARTLVADWLARLRGVLRTARVELHTRSMAEIASVFERGEVDLLVCYEHHALSNRLSGQRFRHLTLAGDRLLPVARADAQGRTRHALDSPQWIGYAPTLSLGRLLSDHLGDAHGTAVSPPSIVCDSADAMLELALKGMGVAWLPHSLAAASIRKGVLKPLGGRGDQVHYEVRLYRLRGRQSPLVEAVWAATNR